MYILLCKLTSMHLYVLNILNVCFTLLMNISQEKQPNKSENEIHLLASHYVLDRIENDKFVYIYT